MLPPPLLTTKLYRPPAAPNWVARPALLARLQAGLTRKLTLISAPPGFGKTTLVSQWLDNFRLPSAAFRSNQQVTPELQDLKFCWLSLDEGDNNLTQFLRYLIAAVRTCVPKACPTTQSLLATTTLPNVDYLANVLVSELTVLATALVLVLDDYHRIRSSEVHAVVRHLLRYLPPALHLIILTRTDPPLHLGRLRIEGQISELRAKDLGFALEETRRFFQQRVGRPLNDATLQTLQARTEGWVTGLQLACLSLQNEDSSQFLAHFRGNDRLLAGYLMEEVMARLPETMQAFLVRTAIVDRFCAALGDALLADSPTPVSSQATIAQLEEQNLFLIPLDEEGTWYRYHDLFRDFLRHQLKHKWMPIDLAHLHQRASVWLAGAGLIEDALRHALAGGADHFAADLVETQLHPLLNQQVPMYTLTRWLALFAEATIQTHPGLLIAQASQAAFGMGPDLSLRRFVQIETLLDQDDTLPPERRQSLQADLNLLRGIFAYNTGELQAAIPYLGCALASLPPAHEFARALATLHLAFVYASQGEDAEGRALLATAMTEAMAEQRPTQIVLLNALALLQFYAADLIAATHTTARIFATVQTKRLSWQGVGLVDVWLGRAYYFQGVIAYEQNNLAAASQHWRQVEALRYRTNPHLYHDGLVGQALVAQAQGAAADALAYAQAALEFAAETRSPVLQANSEALEARLALLAGRITEAVHRAQDFAIPTNMGSSFTLTLPALTRVMTLLAEGSPAALTLALKLTGACLGHAEKMHNTHLTIQITVWQALTLQALGHQDEAYRALSRALTLGEPGGYLRTFLDLGAPMAELLRAFGAQNGQSRYLKRLLAVFGQEHDPAQRRHLTAHYTTLDGITPLTPRELELLALLRQPLSKEEIATTLIISHNTVKNHTRNIYTKLGVRNRRQAVLKAQSLGLLPPA